MQRKGGRKGGPRTWKSLFLSFSFHNSSFLRASNTFQLFAPSRSLILGLLQLSTRQWNMESRLDQQCLTQSLHPPDIYIYIHTHTRYIPTMVFYGEAVGASIEKALASFLIPTGCLFLVLSRRSKKKKKKEKKRGRKKWRALSNHMRLCRRIWLAI